MEELDGVLMAQNLHNTDSIYIYFNPATKFFERKLIESHQIANNSTCLTVANAIQ